MLLTKRVSNCSASTMTPDGRSPNSNRRPGDGRKVSFVYARGRESSSQLFHQTVVQNNRKRLYIPNPPQLLYLSDTGWSQLKAPADEQLLQIGQSMDDHPQPGVSDENTVADVQADQTWAPSNYSLHLFVLQLVPVAADA